jgi:hypothetical protein
VRVETRLPLPLTDLEAIRRALDAQTGPRVPEDTRAEIVSLRAGTLPDLERRAQLTRQLEMLAPMVALSLEVPAELMLPAELLAAAHRLHVPCTALTPGWPACSRPPGIGPGDPRGGVGKDLEEATSTGPGRGRPAADAAVAAPAARPRPPLGDSPFHGLHRLQHALDGAGHDLPVVLVDRPERGAPIPCWARLHAGGALCDGIGDAIHLDLHRPTEARRLAFNILQAPGSASRRPSSSPALLRRTLFDLETTTARIKARTAHLKG